MSTLAFVVESLRSETQSQTRKQDNDDGGEVVTPNHHLLVAYIPPKNEFERGKKWKI
jgi:hypothetical protein